MPQTKQIWQNFQKENLHWINIANFYKIMWAIKKSVHLANYAQSSWRRTWAKGPNIWRLHISRFPQNEACLGVLLLPPGQDASPLQGYPSAICRRYPFIHLGEERQSVGKFFVRETMWWARIEPQTSRSGGNMLISLSIEDRKCIQGSPLRLLKYRPDKLSLNYNVLI